MEAIFFLIPISLVIVCVALIAFVWSVNGNQFDDLEKEGERILLDDDWLTSEAKEFEKPKETKETKEEDSNKAGKSEINANE